MPTPTDLLSFAVGVLLFWLLVNLLDKAVLLERYGVKVSSFFIKYESKRLLNLLEKASDKKRGFWKVISNLGIALGVGLLISAFYFLFENLLKFVQPQGEPSPVLPVLPGLTIRVFWLPYFVLAFLLAALTHEMAHGIVARAEGISMKSAGLFFALVQPGGFVEIDDDQLESASAHSQLRVLSAGSSLNLLTGLLFLLIMFAAFSRTPSGIVIVETVDGGPLDRAGLQRWDVIYAINGSQIDPRSLDDIMTNVTPGTHLTLETGRGEVSITAAPHPEKPGKAMIGFASSMPYHETKLGLSMFWNIQLYVTLSWISLLLVNLAIFNMLPVPYLDGDRFIGYLLRRYAKKTAWAKTLFNAASLLVIATNMAMTIGRGMFAI